MLTGGNLIKHTDSAVTEAVGEGALPCLTGYLDPGEQRECTS